jgi:hypothetical protein
MIRLTAEANNPALRGHRASRVLRFGPGDRFQVYAVHTRFDDVEWWVADNNITYGDGRPWIIRQEPSFDEAIATVLSHAKK